MKKIIYLSAALLSFASTDLMAARAAKTASSSSIMDHVNCTVASVKYAQEDFRKNKLDSKYLETVTRCVNNQRHITKGQEDRYTNFNVALEHTKKHDKEFADYTISRI